MKNRIFIFIASLALLPFFGHAQDNPGNSLKNPDQKYHFSDHLITGGFLGLQFGSMVYVNVAPIIGYKITNRLQAGVGASYTYERWRYQGLPDFVFSAYGGSVWARYFITENLFAHTEYEVLNGPWDQTYRPGQRYNITSVFVGGGYRQQFGRMSSFILVLWNLNDSQDSPYYNPVLRIGMVYGM